MFFFSPNPGGQAVPLTISGLVFWLDASVGITLNGSDVSQWDDQSGNGHHFVQATAADQPAYDATGFKGGPAVIFDGVSEFMDTPDHANFNSDEYTFVFVGKVPEITANGAIFGNRPSSGLPGVAGIVMLEFAASVDEYQNITLHDASSNYRHLNAAADTAPDDNRSMIIAVALNNTSPAIYHDRIDQSFSWSSSSGTVGSVDSTEKPTLGDRPGLSRFGAFTVSDVLLYDRVLSAAELEQLRAYLSDQRTLDFKFTVTTSGADTFALPLVSSGTYNFVIDWGDGNSDTITAWDQAEATHSYGAAGAYAVVISGTCDRFEFAGAGDVTLITDISQWGNINFDSRTGAFQGCTNLEVSATDTPDLQSNTGLATMFRNCGFSTINNLGNWDLNGITTIASMFRDCSNFNQDVSGWDTSTIQSLTSTFRSATSFDQDIGGWDVTSVTAATNMFQGSTLSTANYDALLIGWEGQAVQNTVTFHGGNATYSAGAAATARQALIDDHFWTITDNGPA